MTTQTLLEFATDKILTILLVKERVKYRRRNRNECHHHLEKDCDLSELSTRKKLSRMMPPRYTWVRPSKRRKEANGAIDHKKNAEKALWLTIKRDRDRQKKGESFDYLNEMSAFMDKIRARISSEDLTFESPQLTPIFKDKEKLPDGSWLVTCRPLSVYTQLEDKIILALTSRYLTRHFDRYLHENILSYRPARTFQDKTHYVTDFNDGIRMIKEYREAHRASTIYASDCDIKKFYDCIPHQVVRDCISRMLDQSNLNEEGKAQVMKVIGAYLNSYNFYTNVCLTVKQHNEVFDKIRRRMHDSRSESKNIYQIKWVKEIQNQPQEQNAHIGVSQGGALSLLIANIVLNDVDQVLIEQPDEDRLFIRYCDDMILLHTDYAECSRLMEQYAQSLREHGLYFHEFENVSDGTTRHFWEIKSHRPFLWGEKTDDSNSNRYIGFLGYEIRRDGRMRLRKNNIKRFEEKFQMKFHALRRYKKNEKHSEEEFLTHQKEVLDKLMNGVNFYESFDLEQFKCGSQYRYLQKLRMRIEKRLS